MPARTADPHVVHELRLYIQTTSSLYFGRYMPTVRQLANRMAAGTYDHAQAPAAFKYLVDAAAAAYHPEIGTDTVPKGGFTPAVRRQAQQELADDFRSTWNAGEWRSEVKPTIAKRAGIKRSVGHGPIPWESIPESQGFAHDGAEYHGLRLSLRWAGNSYAWSVRGHDGREIAAGYAVSRARAKMAVATAAKRALDAGASRGVGRSRSRAKGRVRVTYDEPDRELVVARRSRTVRRSAVPRVLAGLREDVAHVVSVRPSKRKPRIVARRRHVGDADRKLVLAIYKRMPVGNKMLRGGKHTIMLSGPSAPAYGVDNYTNLVLEDLSHADLVRAADAVGARLPSSTARSVGPRPRFEVRTATGFRLEEVHAGYDSALRAAKVLHKEFGERFVIVDTDLPLPDAERRIVRRVP